MTGKKRGVGSVIGAAFIVLIILTWYTYYQLELNDQYSYLQVLRDMQELDYRQSSESLEILSVSTTDQNKLNLTVQNNGAHQSHLIWLGVIDESNNSSEYYEIDYYIDPAETVTNIRNETVSINEEESYKIQLITELGNILSCSYPEEVVGDSGWGRYDWVDQICDLHPPNGKGNHSFFSAQQGSPDSIVDILTEENTAVVSKSNQTASSDFDRDDWISNQNSAGDVGAGVLSDTNSSDNTRYELVESKATGGGPPGSLNFLLAWRFDFTSLNDSRTDTRVHIEAQTTGENFRVYWSSDDTTMNYLGNITSTSDDWMDWDVPDDTSTTIYILIKDNNDDRADGTDTTTADSIKIDTLFLEITSGEANHELDLEVQWTDVDYDESNEYLCIYGGTMGSEDVLVDVWNGTSWINILSDLSSGWNSVDISSYLVSSTFNIRFRGGIEISDAIQDSWEIDSTFLNVWT